MCYVHNRSKHASKSNDIIVVNIIIMDDQSRALGMVGHHFRSMPFSVYRCLKFDFIPSGAHLVSMDVAIPRESKWIYTFFLCSSIVRSLSFILPIRSLLMNFCSFPTLMLF